MNPRFGFAAMVAAFAVTFGVVLGGCATTPTGGGRGGAFCDVSSPMTPEAEDAERVSIKLGRQVVAHNRYGGKACGWKP